MQEASSKSSNSSDDDTNESKADKAKEKTSKVSGSRIGVKLRLNYQNTTFTILSGMWDIIGSQVGKDYRVGRSCTLLNM